MTSFKITFLVLFVLLKTGFSLFLTKSDTGVAGVKKAPRWNMPWLWIGMWCNGCPQSSCEDDDAIIHGFCCGCAHAFDSLPILCPQFLQCPLNLHGLCHDYEYMIRCCC